MGGIREFSIERLEVSCNLLVSLCDSKMSKVWLNEESSNNLKAFIYRGSFMDCVEYLYGFIPNVFEEYCKQFGLVVYSRDGLRVGHLDVMQSMYDSGILDLKNFSLLKNIFKARGELIHNTLIDKDVYYKKLSWIVAQLVNSDLPRLCRFILILSDKINESYAKGIDNKLIVRKRELMNGGRTVVGNNSLNPRPLDKIRPLDNTGSLNNPSTINTSGLDTSAFSNSSGSFKPSNVFS